MFQLLYYLIVVLILVVLNMFGNNHLVSSKEDWLDCNKTFNCENNSLTLSYPFSLGEDSNTLGNYCGYQGFRLKCYDGNFFWTVEDKEYVLRSIDFSNRTLTVVDRHLMAQACPATGDDYTLPCYSYISYGPDTHTLRSFKDCDMNSTLVSNFSCLDSNSSQLSYVMDESVTICGTHWDGRCDQYWAIPVLRSAANSSNISIYASPELLHQGFQLTWSNDQCTSCEASGGRCGYTLSDGQYSASLCICPNSSPTSYAYCVDNSGGSAKKKIMIGIFTGLGSFTLIMLIAWRKFGSHFQKNNTNVENFLENYGSLALHRYRYSDLKKITNSFNDKLGQGGYGGVFKGKLKDGRFVAVKVLNESKGNGEEFINEVRTIGRTNHVNIVSLLGFCSEGSKRALVYELMPNGSLEKFIYDEKSTTETNPLGWEKLYQIALGIANGLDYLHRGCNSRILHFDIKPQNILLDNDFTPKISDFGLAKLCPTREDVVSMLNARGTIGYIAPEVYQRNLGGVSSKSDVYSYGMVLLEMVGGRKNIDVTVANTSEIYFPHWIYNHLENERENRLGIHKEKFNEESVKKMIIVGLWCIQTHPSSRPLMSMVVEMLQKSVDELQMPPNPFMDLHTTSLTPT